MDRNELYVKASNFAYKYLPWTCIIYAWRNRYGSLWALTKLYIQTKPRTEPDWLEQQLGLEPDKSKQATFLHNVVKMKNEENVRYRCVYGTCVVFWHPRRGNQGGGGAPGCPCQEMDDPRDLKRGPL